MQTAYHLFKNHPNFDKLNFIVDPDMKEHLHSPCDIPQPWELTHGQFRDLLPNLDVQLMNEACKDLDEPYLWFLDLIESDWGETIKDHLKLVDVGFEYPRKVLEFMLKRQYAEQGSSKRERIKRTQQRLRDVMKHM